MKILVNRSYFTPIKFLFYLRSELNCHGKCSDDASMNLHPLLCHSSDITRIFITSSQVDQLYKSIFGAAATSLRWEKRQRNVTKRRGDICLLRTDHGLSNYATSKWETERKLFVIFISIIYLGVMGLSQWYWYFQVIFPCSASVPPLWNGRSIVSLLF